MAKTSPDFTFEHIYPRPEEAKYASLKEAQAAALPHLAENFVNIIHQLSRHPEGNIPLQLTEHLLEAQRLLVEVKTGFVAPAEWTMHTEQVENVNSVQPFFLEGDDNE